MGSERHDGTMDGGWAGRELLLRRTGGIELHYQRASGSERVLEYESFAVRVPGSGDVLAVLSGQLVTALVAHYLIGAAIGGEMLPELMGALGVVRLGRGASSRSKAYAYPTHKKLRGAEGRRLKGRDQREQLT